MKKFRSPLFAACSIVSTAALSVPIHAASVDWDNESGDSNWNNPVNWKTPATDVSPGNTNNAIPTTPDDAVFIDSAVGVAKITADVTSSPRDIRFGDEGRIGSGVVNHSAGSMTATGSVRMGITSGSSGSYNLSGTGNLQVNGQMIVGEQSGASGSLTVANSSTLKINGSLVFADQFGTTGTAEHINGAVTYAANNSNSLFNLGVNGNASYDMSGGSLTQAVTSDPTNQSTWNRMAVNPGSEATFNLSGGTVSFHARTFFGAGGTATVNQTGGIMEVRQGEANIADTGTSTYNLSGGTFRTLNAGNVVSVGQWDNSNGRLNVSSNGTADFAGIFIVAAGQDPFPVTGLVEQTGGIVRLRNGFTIGNSLQATGTYNLSGGLLRQEDVANVEDGNTWTRIGANGNATFNLSGGTASFDARVLVGTGRNDTNSDAQAVVNQTGGTFEVRRRDLTIGDSGDAIYNISGGTVQTLQEGLPITVGQWDNTDSQLNVSANAIVISAGDLNVGAGRFDSNQGNATPTPNPVITPSKGTVTQTGGIVSVGNNLNISSGNTSQTGIYNLQNGVLDLTGGNINTGTGTSTFNMTGGELRNASVINGNSATAPTNAGAFVQSGGVFKVGVAEGTASETFINGNYSLLAAGTLQFDIGAGVADALTVNGGALITLAGNISLVAPAGLAFPQTFTIINNNTAVAFAGAFANAPDDTLFYTPGYTWRIDYQGGDGNDAVLTLVVPEPGTGALLLFSMALGGFSSRRRRRA